MHIIFGLISMFLVLLLEYLLLISLDFSLHSLRLWFILPIGGLLVGALCGLGIFLYLKKAHIRASAKHYLASALIAFLGFWVIHYFTYASTYIDEDGKVNNLFQGEHISNFLNADFEPIGFGDYLDITFENTEVSFTRRSGQSFNLGEGYNKTSFYFDMLGFAIGGLLIGPMVLGNKRYCEKCKKYMKEDKLYDINYSDWERESLEFHNAMHGTKEDFEKFIKKERVLSKTEPYFSVTLTHCPSCKDAFITLRFMQPKKDSYGNITWEENKQYNQKIDMHNKMVL